MTVLCSGPCSPWTSAADMTGPCADLSADELNDYIAVASDLLYEWSGKQFNNICSEIIRPYGARHDCGCIGPFSPLTFMDLPISTIRPDFPTCSCEPLSQLVLPARPVTSVEYVKIDGATLDSSAYRVDDWKWLVRLDGGRFPCCQNLNLASDQPGTFEIGFSYGHPVPAPGVLACKVFACEIAMANSDDPSIQKKCRLPRNAVSVVRQGVSILRANVGVFQKAPNGPVETGLWEVQAFLSAYNPYGRTSRSVVLSPDLPDTARRTDT